jgi:hypothetical protein
MDNRKYFELNDNKNEKKNQSSQNIVIMFIRNFTQFYKYMMSKKI